MRKIIVILSALFFFTSNLMAQDSAFVINGHLEKIKDGTIFLNIYKNNETFKDSAAINDGKFRFTGFISSPYFATLTLPERRSDYFTFYIEPAQMQILGRGDSLKLLTVKGSEVNSDDKLLKEKRMKPVTEWESNNSKIYEEAYKAKNRKVMDSLDQVDLQILAAKRKVVSSFVKEYPNLCGAMAILENFSYYAEADDVRPLYEAARTPSIQKSTQRKTN